MKENNLTNQTYVFYENRNSFYDQLFESSLKNILYSLTFQSISFLLERGKEEWYSLYTLINKILLYEV